MSRIARFAVLVTALASLFAVLSSTAGAVTFTNSGSTSFTATGGPGTLAITGTTINNMACAGSSVTGTVPSGVFTAVTGSVTFSPCTLIGIHTKWVCSYSLTPVSFASPVTTGVADVNCLTTLATSPNTPLCNITGTTPGQYTNPSGATKGKLTLTPSNTLVVSNANDDSCSWYGVSTGTTRPGDLTDQTINVTNGSPTTLGPVITSP